MKNPHSTFVLEENDELSLFMTTDFILPKVWTKKIFFLLMKQP
jgi:hypothetical protein